MIGKQQSTRFFCFVASFIEYTVDSWIFSFTSAKAKNRAEMDWSAIGLNVAEEAGIDISKDLNKNYKAIEDAKKVQ